MSPYLIIVLFFAPENSGVPQGSVFGAYTFLNVY